MRRLALCAAALFMAVESRASGPMPWPQFRGPDGSAVAAEGEHPPVEIGPEKNVLWKVETPAGASSPIVVGDLLVMTAFDNEKLLTIAYRRSDGSEVWRAEAPYTKLEPFHKTEGSPAASTSATDGERIVSYFGSCGLFCYDLAGKELWRHEMPPAATLADFGTGVSPIIVDGVVVLLRDESKDSKILALDVATGHPKWEKARESKAGFSTPVVWEQPGGKQVVAAGFGQLIGYDLANGEKHWFVAGMPSACCASPSAAEGKLFFAGWAPGDPADSDFKMPEFDALLGQAKDDDGDGKLSKAEAQRTPFANFFDNNDPNKDGFITREEWGAMLAFIGASRNSAFVVKPGGSGDITDTHVAWKATRGLPYVPSAIVYRGQYVMVKDGGIVTAYNAESGRELYQKRLAAPGSYYASPVAADGRIYFTALADGSVTVIEAGSDEPKVLAKNPSMGERASATPAIANNTIYLRTAGHLYAFATPK